VCGVSHIHNFIHLSAVEERNSEKSILTLSTKKPLIEKYDIFLGVGSGITPGCVRNLHLKKIVVEWSFEK
jgi:hypothetical protein